jgi:predicted heme/steroid binding protein
MFMSLLRPAMDELPKISKRMLSLRNGVDKDEIWVAYRGLVYDLGESRLWKNGKHYEHWAGQDLTDELKNAPHTERVFDRFKAIGRLTDS